jgi:hypothetical protein
MSLINLLTGHHLNGRMTLVIRTDSKLIPEFKKHLELILTNAVNGPGRV